MATSASAPLRRQLWDIPPLWFALAIALMVTLHWLLRAWIPLHILATAVMLALMLVHVGQVIFFNVR